MLFVIGADRSCKQPRGARKRPAAGETCRFRAANGAVQATRQGSLFAARRKCRAPVIRNSSQSGGSLFCCCVLRGARTPVDFFKNPRRGKFSVLLANGGVAAEENLAFQNACVLKMASTRNSHREQKALPGPSPARSRRAFGLRPPAPTTVQAGSTAWRLKLSSHVVANISPLRSR